MIPLLPPKGYWDKIHSIISKFIWGGRCPCIKLTTLQCIIQNVVLMSLTKFYSWSYVQCPLSNWLDPHIQPSWRPIEVHLASPYHLRALRYSGLSIKYSKLKLGPMMSCLLNVWFSVERMTSCMLKWHSKSTIFHNYSLLMGGVPFSFKEWSERHLV